MIRHIAGTVQFIEDAAIVVDVNGIGYQVYVSQPHDFKLEDPVHLHVHHAIRETASDLFGFLTRDELEIFELLLTLPKIGPKSAAQVMAQTDIELIIAAVHNDDPSHLSKMSGVGKKTAEKIVGGLKDAFAERGYGAATVTASEGGGNTWQADAVDALISLGYPHSEARAAVLKLPPMVQNANDAVRTALKELGQA